MLRLRSRDRFDVRTFEHCGALAQRCLLVLAIVCALGSSALAATTAASPSVQTAKHSDVRTETKWDAGQKDLLASMEAEADQAKQQQSKQSDEPIYVTLLSFVFKLALVAALAYGTIYVLKRLNVQSFKRASTASIKIVENTTLAANRSLHLVEVGSKRLLVASTPGQISLLTEVENETAPGRRGNSGSERPEVLSESGRIEDLVPNSQRGSHTEAPMAQDGLRGSHTEAPMVQDSRHASRIGHPLVLSRLRGSRIEGRPTPPIPNFRDQLTSFLGARILGKVDTLQHTMADDSATADSPEQRIAHHLRETTAFMREKVLVVGRARKGLRDA